MMIFKKQKIAVIDDEVKERALLSSAIDRHRHFESVEFANPLEALEEIEKEKLLSLAKENSFKSIEVYENWLRNMGDMNIKEIRLKIKPYFKEEDRTFESRNLNNIIKKRIDEIKLAQKETKRRLSVSYTNLGIIQRHEYKQNDAIRSYVKAIDLWNDNFIARNNLSVLLGKPIKKRSLIEKLIPKDRYKK